MNPNLRKVLLAGTAIASAAFAAAHAIRAFAGECPTSPGNVNGGVGYATMGCDILITLNPSGVASLTTGPSAGLPMTPGLTPGTYDGLDDVLVGVLNNSGETVGSLNLLSPNAIGLFDGDGISVQTNPESGLPGLGLTTTGPNGTGYVGTDSPTATADLNGPMNFFSDNMIDSVTVNFPGGVPNGGSAFFSLDDVVTSATFTASVAPTSEPATVSLVGAALAGFGLVRRRRKISSPS